MSLIDRLRANICKVFLGNPKAVDQVICCLLARGHVLIEDVPGVGKTVLATALARSLDCTFSRIQLTPDLLPSDILGVSVYVREASQNGHGGAGMGRGQPAPGDSASAPGLTGGTGRFDFKRGPIFANVVLADEINRTPPRTQTALLEAMQEGTVTADGRQYPLDRPFMIIATQNPFDFEGTYALPENQMDRFFMRIGLGYPNADEEARVLSQRPAEHALQELRPVLTTTEVRSLQARVDAVRLDKSLVDYIVAVAHATRNRDDLQVGLSPRGSLALAQAARATAVLNDRAYAIPEDILDNLLPVCAHRVVPRTYTPVRSATVGGRDEYPEGSSQAILTKIIESIPSPA